MLSTLLSSPALTVYAESNGAALFNALEGCLLMMSFALHNRRMEAAASICSVVFTNGEHIDL